VEILSWEDPEPMNVMVVSPPVAIAPPRHQPSTGDVNEIQMGMNAMVASSKRASPGHCALTHGLSEVLQNLTISNKNPRREPINMYSYLGSIASSGVLVSAPRFHWGNIDVQKYFMHNGVPDLWACVDFLKMLGSEWTSYEVMCYSNFHRLYKASTCDASADYGILKMHFLDIRCFSHHGVLINPEYQISHMLPEFAKEMRKC
jgi:hypothetical protein